jgi:hypothetical protein
MLALMECGDLHIYVMKIVKITITLMLVHVGKTVGKIMLIMVPHVIHGSLTFMVRKATFLEVLPISKHRVILVTIKVEHFAIEIAQRWVWKTVE